MSYRADPRQPLSDELLRALRTELDATLACVADIRTPSAERVRRARKGTKRLRALLHLIRGPAAAIYEREYPWLRESARQLSDLRDADAAVETTQLLAECCRTKTQQRAMEPLRRHLQQARSASDASDHAQRQLGGFVERLLETQTRLSEVSFAPAGFELIADGLGSCYSAARRRFRRACARPSPTTFHECRKAAKRLATILAFLRRAWPDQIKAVRSSLRELNTVLGQHHDLVLLRSLLKSRSAPIPASAKAGVAKAIVERLAELEKDAQPLGQRIFVWKRRSFTRAMETWWRSAGGSPSATP